jgi:cytochrome P450
VAALAERWPLLHAPRRGPLDAIPGSDSYLELYRLLRDTTGFFHERFDKHGPVFRSRFVQPVVFLVGAEANKTILVTRRLNFSYGLGYGHTGVRFVFEKSLMLMDGEEHQHARDILSPAMGKLALRESSDRIQLIWSTAVSSLLGRTADVYVVAQKSTFDVAASALVGLSLGAETESYRPHFERLIDGVMAATPIRYPYGRLDRALKARVTLIELLRPRIEAARGEPPSGLLGQLAHYRDADGKYLPPDDIAKHLLLLFWAGYDTTASAGAWVIQTLAQRLDWQERLRDEARSVLGDEPITPDNQASLVQFGWFLSEIERMYPSALFFPRVALEDFPLGRYTIPKGVPLFYSPYMSHRDPAAFDHPNAFDPERWNPERGDRHAKPADLVGFGGGARVCLGKAFAKLQLKIMIRELVRQVQLEPDPLCRPKIQGVPVHHPVGSRVVFNPME